MKNGIPFDIAFDLDYITRAAWSIVFSEMEGATFLWDQMRFKSEDS